MSNGISLSAEKVNRFGALLLAASWLEDNVVQDPLLTQIQLFDQFILPASELFLNQVETHAVSDFYAILAITTCEALVALREELTDG
ncbi:MAG: hypothetical protein ACL7BU_14485 [Candidatus Phlomobacter fragariae]